MSSLFTVPISTGGSFECTEPAKNVYLLTFNSPPDNRIATPILTALSLSLNIIEHKYPPGALIVTSSNPKFYSNGFDLDHVRTTPGFSQNTLHPVLRRLLT
jgi:enoyl-CoA hydratase/carnithine racemase